jgi:protein subunit release factor A
MPRIISGGKWAEDRLRHLRQLLEQTTDEEERRKIEHEIEQLKPEASLRRRFLRMLLPGMK